MIRSALLYPKQEKISVTESPVATECVRGQLMTGAGAKVLKDTLQKVNMPYKEDEVYYTTAVKCAVPKKKGQKFPADAPVNCRQYLLNEIRAVKPKMILVCGATAIQTLMANKKLKVTELVVISPLSNFSFR